MTVKISMTLCNEYERKSEANVSQKDSVRYIFNKKNS